MKYLCDPHVIPTVVPRDLDHLLSYAAFVATFSDSLHVDIDDGQFAPSTTWPLSDPQQLAELDTLSLPPQLAYEAHLMTANPADLGVRFAHAGFSRIVMHREPFGTPAEARAALDECRAAGAREAGLALLLETPLSLLEEVAPACDFVHLLSVARIGEQGQPFDESTLSRVEELHALYPDLMVSIDGGVTEATVEQLVRAGANRLAVGAAISTSEDPASAFARIHERAMRGCAPISGEVAAIA